MKKIDLSKVFESASSMSNESQNKSFARANKNLHSLSALIKSLKEGDVWCELEAFFAFFDIDSQKQLTPKAIISLIPKGMMKDGEMCIVKKTYEKEKAICYRLVDGKSLPIISNGKPLEHSVFKLNEKGEKIVSGYSLHAIKTWSLNTLRTLLQQAYQYKLMSK